MALATRAAHEDRSPAVRHLNRLMDQMLGRGFHPYCPRETWSPPVNLYEYDNDYYVVADLAGMRIEDIDLQVKKAMLTLSGSRETPDPTEDGGSARLHLMEIDHGKFCREVQLPADADAKAIEAVYRNGFLWVRIPKQG